MVCADMEAAKKVKAMAEDVESIEFDAKVDQKSSGSVENAKEMRLSKQKRELILQRLQSPLKTLIKRASLFALFFTAFLVAVVVLSYTVVKRTVSGEIHYSVHSPRQFFIEPLPVAVPKLPPLHSSPVHLFELFLGS